ncbi:MFS transporter [Candidatus Bathyarchaeota archaeon]|nr:MFS transporter [Candidatus Bathyarchaeota archaeon]
MGADPQQLGILNSVSTTARTIFALPLGWFSDRVSLKKIIIAGLFLSIIVPAAFAFSTNWIQVMPVMMVNTIETVLLGMFLNVYFISSISEASDRATGMSMKNTLTALVAVVIPTTSAIIVLNFGGISVEGIRPLFFIQMFAGLIILIYTLLKLKEVSFLQKKDTKQEKRSIFQDYKEIAKISSVRKWTFFKGLRTVFGGTAAFYSIYYVEFKGASPVILAAMGTVGVIISLIILLPFGQLADKHGRKKMLFLTRPFNYISILIIIFAPTPEYLILASILGSLQSVSQLMEITMEHELVPPEQRGRWGGFLFFFMGMVGIPGPLLIGYLWERMVNPGYLFLLQILADLPFVAIISTIPDTLHITYDKKPSQ